MRVKLAFVPSSIIRCQDAPSIQRNSRKFRGASYILIEKSYRRLTLYQNQMPAGQYPVAIGKADTPTPIGDFHVVTKIKNPGGVLGTRWMGLNIADYGIHGTPFPWTIGTMASHGCVRMYNHDAENLFLAVPIGLLVRIRP